jgi:putative (di)nucleoside polyphosphate hydrolase
MRHICHIYRAIAAREAHQFSEVEQMARKTVTRTDAEYRPGVGIMLLDSRGEVFVARRADVPGNAWQMPQGGIDEGEEPRQAALRELREEIGTDKAEIIAESAAWLRYDLPGKLMGKAWDKRWRGQRQKWFIMRFTGADADIRLDTVHPEFVAWKWVSVRELPNLVVSFKRQVYVDLLAEFPELTRTVDDRLSELLAEPIVRMAMAADNVDERGLYDLLRRVSKSLRARGS